MDQDEKRIWLNQPATKVVLRSMAEWRKTQIDGLLAAASVTQDPMIRDIYARIAMIDALREEMEHDSGD